MWKRKDLRCPELRKMKVCIETKKVSKQVFFTQKLTGENKFHSFPVTQLQYYYIRKYRGHKWGPSGLRIKLVSINKWCWTLPLSMTNIHLTSDTALTWDRYLRISGFSLTGLVNSTSRYVTSDLYMFSLWTTMTQSSLIQWRFQCFPLL